MKLWRLFSWLAIGLEALAEKADNCADRLWTATCVRCGYVVRYGDRVGVWNAPDEGWVCSNCYRENEP